MDAAIIFRGVILFVVALCIPLLMYIGFRLFVMGAKGEITISHDADGKSSKISNLSPGAFCFLLAVGLGAYLTFNDLLIEQWSDETTRETPHKPHTTLVRGAKSAMEPQTGNNTSTSQPVGTVSTLTRISLYDGINIPFSDLVLNEYAQLGICLHGAYVSNRIEEKINDCLIGVNKLMSRPISYGLLKDLRSFEEKHEEGDQAAKSRIDAWKADFVLNKGS
ncbi:hypothetical protein [Rheinheimera faecalis]